MANDFTVCPRCNSEKIEEVFRSPVPGAWVVYRGPCGYMFRSTEPDTMTDPDKYDPTFKVKLEDLPNAPMMPAIPPLRHK